MDRVNKNLEKIKFKYLTQAIDKIAEYNKWADKKYNRILIWCISFCNFLIKFSKLLAHEKLVINSNIIKSIYTSSTLD